MSSPPAQHREYMKRWRDRRFPLDDPDCKCLTVGCCNRASRAMGNGYCVPCTQARKHG